MCIRDRGEGGIHIGKILLGVLKNPMVLAILAGLPFAYFQVELPYVASKSLSYLQVATSTMALLVVGASIKLDAIREDLALLLRVSGIKLLVMPAIWGVMAVAAGLSAEQIVKMCIRDRPSSGPVRRTWTRLCGWCPRWGR